MSSALYVYGISDSTDVDLGPEVGVGDSVPSMIPVDGLGAITERIDAEAFASSIAGIAQPGEIEHQLRAHQAILDRAVELIDVVPLRFGTIVRDEDGLRLLVERNHVHLSRALEECKGKVEWSIAVYLPEQPPAVSSWGSSSGRAYLEGKRARREQQLVQEQDALHAARTLHRSLEEVCRDAKELPIVKVGDATPASRTAYLVDRSQRAAFLEEVTSWQERFGPKGLQVEVSGPWPPYNFTRVTIDD